MKTDPKFPGLLEAFFMDRLMSQRQVSSNTIASYRDTFCLLFGFAEQRMQKAPSALTINDLDAPFIGAFLEHLEKERGNTARSRNVRLAAIHSFFKYVALQDPAHSAVAQRVLAMPTKRYARKPIDFLTRPEMDALLAAPDQNTWTGRRDKTLLLLTIQTGMRVSEVIGLTIEDIVLDHGSHVRCKGKGRKERCTPLRKEIVTALQIWLREHHAQPHEPLFPNARGRFLSRDGVEYLLSKYAAIARKRCSSLQKKNITPHVLRHTLAMDLFHHGVDRSVIALWLGHESIETTQIYIKADLKMKEQALAKTKPFGVRPGRYQPDDYILAFLKGL